MGLGKVVPLGVVTGQLKVHPSTTEAHPRGDLAKRQADLPNGRARPLDAFEDLGLQPGYHQVGDG